MWYPAGVRCALPLALAGLVALGSCSVAVNVDDTNFRCDAQHACPAEYTCSGTGFCVRPDWRCGKVNVLADDFEDGTVGWQWLSWAEVGGGALSEEGGQGVAAPAAGGAEASGAWYESAEWYDWLDSRVYVEVPQSVNPTAGARAFLALVFDGDDTISIVHEADQLWFKRSTGGAETTLGSILYDPGQHRWWQLRAAEGQTRWQTSPDGFDWTTRFEETQLQPPSLARIRFGAASDADVADPGAARFDNLNGGVPLGHTCRAQDLDEDFEGSGTDGWRRSYEMGGAHLEASDGTAVVYLSDADGSEGGYASSEAYTLVDNGVAIRILEVPGPAAGVSTWLRVVGRGGGDWLGVRVEQDTLYFEQCLGGSVAVMGSVLLAPEAHTFWAISARSGEVHWSTSPDGSSWNTEVTAPAAFPLDTLTVTFGATATAPPAGSTVARFDDVL